MPGFRAHLTGSVLAVVAFVAWLLAREGTSRLDQAVVDGLWISSTVYGAAMCALAARRRPDERSAWLWLAAACVVWGAAAGVWTWYELVLGQPSPSPSWGDIGFIGYALPAVIGVSRLASSGRTRGRSGTWLDVLVISLGMFTLSWLLVLGQLTSGLSSASWLVGFVTLAYPAVDVVLASVVIGQGMRVGRGRRLSWLLLGSGLLCITASDTLWVRMALERDLQPTDVINASWFATFLLIGLAALAPASSNRQPTEHRLSLAQECLPILPVLLVAAALPFTHQFWAGSQVTAGLLVALAGAVVGRYVLVTRDHLRLADQLESKVSERTAELEYLAYHDTLTGLPNREAFMRQLISRIDDPEHACAVLYLDLDGFKSVNDGLGHSVGDHVLQVVGARLRSALRSGDFLARLGGDEFGVVATATDAASAERLAERLIDALSAPVAVRGRRLAMGVSIGIAPRDRMDTAEELLRNADLAMYQMKARGGTGWRVFERSTQEDSLLRLSLETDITSALQRGELEVFYQPLVRLRSGEFAGAEALLRWRHPAHGLLTPDKFLDLAEHSGAIGAIGNWVLDQACAELGRWQEVHSGTETLGVAVNVSGRQLGDGFAWSVRRALRRHGIDPGSLTLEITEGVIQADANVVTSTVGQLKALGVWLAIDDFGTGHSSLARLRDHAFDELKIDRSFVGDLAAGDATFVHAQIALAHALNMQVVAEGVETQEQLDCLRQADCDQVQGYLFGKPMPADEVRRLFTGPALAALATSERSDAAPAIAT